MPIYEYLCEDCGTKFEKLVRRQSETPDIECPSCGHKHLKQELSTFAAHAHGGAGTHSDVPMCPNGGVCHKPGGCGMNFEG
jgi:putative FmdB family regulatory protein